MTDEAGQARRQLAAYKTRLDVAITQYCNELLGEVGVAYTPYSQEVAEVFCSILRRGGKRLRGALVLSAYEMLGGSDEKLALHAAVAIEMIHAYLLIADDICDRSLTRRGGKTAHSMLREYHHTRQLYGDSSHFGISQAINAALLGSHLAQLELVRLPIDDTTKLELLHDLNTVLITTIHGQINDIANEAVRTVDEAQVRSVLIWKTSYYSFLNPLQVGVTLAGGDVADVELLKKYAEHMGLAFQIADDIMGVFGDESASGKSTLDDLREGKVTLLMTRTLERANSVQKTRLLEILGNPELSTTDQEAAKAIIEETGALDYAQRMADKQAREAMRALDAAPAHWRSEQVAFLRELTLLMTKRHA